MILIILIIITRTRSQWGAIANPHAKVFDPSTPKSHSWGKTPTTERKLCSICFLYFICENTHNVCYKKIFEIDVVSEI